jgi:hypothetical protein
MIAPTPKLPNKAYSKWLKEHSRDVDEVVKDVKAFLMKAESPPSSKLGVTVFEEMLRERIERWLYRSS